MTSKTEETSNLLKEAGETQLGNENVTLKGIIRSNKFGRRYGRIAVDNKENS